MPSLHESLCECLDLLGRQAMAWAELDAVAKDGATVGPALAEAIALGPLPAARALALAVRGTAALERGAPPPLPGPVRAMHGRRELSVLPALPYDRLLFRGYRCDVRLGPGPVQRMPLPPQGTALVLGAGNLSSIPIADLLTALMRGQRSVLVKLHPLHRHLQPLFEQVFAPLRAFGCGFVCGGAEEGEGLLRDASIGHVHLTGSRATFARVRETLASRPHVTVTAELGNVTPVIVVPGRFTGAELRATVDELTAMLCINGGFNCATPRVIVTARAWPQREAFLDLLRTSLRGARRRRAWHPGCVERLTAAVPSVALEDDRLPFTLIEAVDPDSERPEFRTECFGPLAFEVPLRDRDPCAFLRSAVGFCNQRLEGELVAHLMVARDGLRRDRAAIDEAVDALAHGTVAVCGFGALAFAWMSAPWGANRRSGLGFAHDPYLLADPLKTVVRAPAVAWPRPPWREGVHHAADTLRHILTLTLAPSLPRALRAACSALRR